MTLIKTSLLNAIAVAIRMLTLLGLNKILAIYVGPAGYAVIGQLQNVITIIRTFSGGAINTGVTKYTAEHYESEEQQHKVWQTALRICLILSLIVSATMAILNRHLAEIIFSDPALGSIFLWFSATLFLFVLNSTLLAIINGKKEVKLYIAANIAGSLIGFLITAILAYLYGLYGALLALVTNQSIVLLATLWLCRYRVWFKFYFLWGSIDLNIAQNLSKYVLMALTTAIVIPVSHMFIRDHLVSNFGWEGAGYWDAIWRISSIYLMFVTTTLGIYYLPKLSEIKEKSELRSEILSGYKVILPIVLVLSSLIYIFRDLIISILFTKDFHGMSELFAWQMAGDTVKISSWLLGYVCTAKALVRIYISSEVVFSLSFYLFVIFLSDRFGLKSTVIAHFINYIFHFLFMVYFLRRADVI